MRPSASTAGGRRATRWTREAIIEKVRAWDAAYGEPPCSADWNPSLARWRAQEWRAERYREGTWPSTNATKRLFGGSFAAAVKAAGLEPHKPGPRRRPAGAARPDIGQRAPATPRTIDEALLAAEERVVAAECRAAALERRLAAVEARAERAEDKLSDARGRARRANERAGRARRARERVAVAERDLKLAAGERIETLVADAAARTRAADDQAQAAVHDAVDAHRARRAAEARAAAAEARAATAERMQAVCGSNAAWQAARAAEARATAAERRAAELAELVCGEPRRLTASELDDLRAGGPSGPAVLAVALRTLHRARARGDRLALESALAELASAAVRWRERL
jgi:hypothetical protein